jgi:hypothetical protein
MPLRAHYERNEPCSRFTNHDPPDKSIAPKWVRIATAPYHGSNRRRLEKCHFDSQNGVRAGPQQLFLGEIEAIRGPFRLARNLRIPLVKVRTVKVV